MDENPKIIPTGFAPLDFLVAMVMPSIAESILESWDAPVFELAEKAKDKGLKGVDVFLHSSGAQEKRYRYGITKIGQEILEKLLKGEFKTLEELKEKQLIKNQYQEDLPYVLFHYTQYNSETLFPRSFDNSEFLFS